MELEKPATGDDGGGRRGVAFSAALILLTGVAAAGLWLAYSIRERALDAPVPLRHNIFYYLFHENEPAVLSICACFFLFGLVWPRLAKRAGLRPRFLAQPALVCAAAGVFVLVTGAAGALAVFHSFPLSMDEFNAGFQARIFLRGHLAAQLPAAWQALSVPLTPFFVTLNQAEHFWVSNYLPVYAGIRTVFLAAGLEPATNGVLSALSILGIFAAARRIWPSSPASVSAAVLFLASSSQLLLTSMTSYSMPAHLCFNLFWLAAYLSPRLGPRLLAPWIGMAAMGLHNPLVHSLFAAPFVLRLLRDRKFAWGVYYSAVYLLSAGSWFLWLRFSYYSAGTSARGFGSFFSLPSLLEIQTQLMNVCLVMSWQMPLVPVLAIYLFLSRGKLSPLESDLLFSLLLTFGVYLFFTGTQGHGWGYRYIFGVLGNLTLLAVAGARRAVSEIGERPLLVLAGAGTALALLIFLPLRSLQAEVFVRPYASFMHALESRPEPVVVVDARAGWYAQDFVRNDPFLERSPKILGGHFMTREHWEQLEWRFGRNVHIVSSEELRRSGIPHLPVQTKRD